MIFAFQILRHFAAKEATREGMLRIAGDFGGMAGRVDVQNESAGIWTIEGADGMFLLGHVSYIVAERNRRSENSIVDMVMA